MEYLIGCLISFGIIIILVKLFQKTPETKTRKLYLKILESRIIFTPSPNKKIYLVVNIVVFFKLMHMRDYLNADITNTKSGMLLDMEIVISEDEEEYTIK